MYTSNNIFIILYVYNITAELKLFLQQIYNDIIKYIPWHTRHCKFKTNLNNNNFSYIKTCITIKLNS
jgi:hypothetical protein